jgi:hypothetical protein
VLQARLGRLPPGCRVSPAPECCARLDGQCCESRLSARMVQSIHAVLRNALESGVREEIISRNVARLVQVPAPRYKVNRGLTTPQAKATSGVLPGTGWRRSTSWRSSSAGAVGSCSACAGRMSIWTGRNSKSSRPSSASAVLCASCRLSRSSPQRSAC